MDDPLRGNRILCGDRIPGSGAAPARVAKLAHNVFSCAVDRQDPAPFQALCLYRRRRLERLAVGSKPRFRDPVSTHARIQSARNCLHFRQFRHSSIVEDAVKNGAPSAGVLLQGLILVGAEQLRDAQLPHVHEPQAETNHKDAY